jgi:S-adenosylmethionine synthetase
VRLCRHYLDRFGQILHHNADKVLLVGGSAHAWLGGGEVTVPIEIYWLAERRGNTTAKEFRYTSSPSTRAIHGCGRTCRAST